MNRNSTHFIALTIDYVPNTDLPTGTAGQRIVDSIVETLHAEIAEAVRWQDTDMANHLEATLAWLNRNQSAFADHVGAA